MRIADGIMHSCEFCVHQMVRQVTARPDLLIHLGAACRWGSHSFPNASPFHDMTSTMCRPLFCWHTWREGCMKPQLYKLPQKLGSTEHSRICCWRRHGRGMPRTCTACCAFKLSCSRDPQSEPPKQSVARLSIIAFGELFLSLGCNHYLSSCGSTTVANCAALSQMPFTGHPLHEACAVTALWPAQEMGALDWP